MFWSGFGYDLCYNALALVGEVAWGGGVIFLIAFERVILVHYVATIIGGGGVFGTSHFGAFRHLRWFFVKIGQECWGTGFVGRSWASFWDVLGLGNSDHFGNYHR